MDLELLVSTRKFLIGVAAFSRSTVENEIFNFESSCLTAEGKNTRFLVARRCTGGSAKQRRKMAREADEEL